MRVLSCCWKQFAPFVQGVVEGIFFLLPFFALVVLHYAFAMQVRAWMLFAAALSWTVVAIVARIRRLFGAHDPFADKDWPRPLLLGVAVWLLDQADKRFYGRQKSGGWA